MNETTEEKTAVSPPPEAPAESREKNLTMMLDVPLTFSAQLGHCTQTVNQILQLTRGKIVELEKLAGEPLDILLNGQRIAQGEAVVVNERFGVRILDIASPSERIFNLGS